MTLPLAYSRLPLRMMEWEAGGSEAVRLEMAEFTEAMN